MKIDLSAVIAAVAIEEALQRKLAGALAKARAEAGDEPDAEDDDAWLVWSNALDDAQQKHGVSQIFGDIDEATTVVISNYRDALAQCPSTPDSMLVIANCEASIRGVSPAPAFPVHTMRRLLLASAKRLIAKL